MGTLTANALTAKTKAAIKRDMACSSCGYGIVRLSAGPYSNTARGKVRLFAVTISSNRVQINGQ
jgi:hypothetical protein